MAFLLVAVVLVATCPSRRAHKEALNQLMNELIDERVENTGGLVGAVLDSIGKTELEEAGEVAIDHFLMVDDYYVASVGSLEIGHEHHVISVGVCGHVFTPDKDDVKRELRQFGL